MNLLLLFAFSQAFFPFSAGSRLSAELFGAVFNNHQDGKFGHREADASSVLQAKWQSDEFPQNPLFFVHGKDCHSVMTKEFGEFSFPMLQNYKHGNIWCNWVIWAGPRRHVIVNITGFVSDEDCTTNQDAIIFHGIASATEDTVIHACSNQNTHVYATQAVAVHVVYLSNNSAKKKVETSFHGSYYTFDDFGKMRLTNPSLSLVAKELGWLNFSEPSTNLTNDLMRSQISTATVPKETEDTAKPFSFATLMEHFNSELFIHASRSTEISKSSATMSNKGTQMSFELFTTQVAETDSYSSTLEPAVFSAIASRIGLSTPTVQNSKLDGTHYAHTASKNGVGYATLGNVISLMHGVKPASALGAVHRGFTSTAAATGNKDLVFDLLPDNITIHNELSEKGLRPRTGLDHYDFLHTSQSKKAFLMERNKEKPISVTYHQAVTEASSQTVYPYLEAKESLKDGIWFETQSCNARDSAQSMNKNALLLSSMVPNRISEEKPTIPPTATFNPHVDLFTSKIANLQVVRQEKAHTSQELGHNFLCTKGPNGGFTVSHVVHKYVPSIREHDSSMSLSRESINKLVHTAVKGHRRKIPLFKDDRKNRRNGRKNFEARSKKKESAPAVLDSSKMNSTISSPMRVVKDLKTPTSETEQLLVGPPKVPQRPPPLQEGEAVNVFSWTLSELEHEMGNRMEGVHVASTVRSQDRITVNGRHREDPFGRVAVSVALEKNVGLKNHHNPGDTLFELTIGIEHRAVQQKEAQVPDEDFLLSIQEKIKEKLHYSSDHLNEIILKHFQRTRAFRAVLTFWIHLRSYGKNLHYYKTLLKTLSNVSVANGTVVLVLVSVQDVDECASGIAQCSEAEDCANEMGTYTCKCKRGYEPRSADAAGAACVLSPQSGLAFPFGHLEILVGSLLGVVLLLLLAIVVLCTFAKKRQVKRALCDAGRPSATNHAIVQPGPTAPGFGHASSDAEYKACRRFPVVKLADAGGHASGQSFNRHLSKVTLEQSPCL